jgi:5,10-methylenetetrahydromethanopterin reductase
MAHFSGMRGSSADGVAPEDRAVFDGIHARYEREKHTLGRARHAASLEPEFLDRFAVVGPPQTCVERLRELVEAGVSKLIVTGASFDADRSEAARSRTLFEREVLPALK